MKLDSLKDLEKLIKLCRRLGVDNIETNDIKLKLGTQPVKSYRPRRIAQLGEISENIQIQTPDMPTPEDLLFYSVAGEQ